MEQNRLGLTGKRFRDFLYTVSSDWVDEFRSITGEPRLIDGQDGPTVPQTLSSVLALNICQQRWFDLAKEIDASWTADTLMIGEQTYLYHKPLLADVPYAVSNEIVRIEEKQGRQRFDAITFQTVFREGEGAIAFEGTTTFIVLK